ncbi:FkbM family methyltransferase [uncultured Massilia sp.]|uniref:FkbM family methyltransferase n=1 Tax=uncultured Massilia sp. TaxID=169973 RepID=UPI0025CBBEE6|nr:FkbM family methyltransferase [uncultured Massilia sp.]
MTFISYAQNAEDVLLWRALGRIENGFYIDVGANDPVEHSVTKAFYDAGWRGINVEPLPVHVAAFDEQRPGDVNLAVAAGSADGELTLYDVPSVRGWASPQQDVAEMHRAEGHAVAELKVPVRTLSAICAEHVRGEIHFLKIDVEGFEGEVLRGMDFARWRPWILVIEATLPGKRETNHEAWEHLVTSQRYRFAWFDGLNRYYVADEHAELREHFGIQPNVFDAFISWHLDRAWNDGKRLQGALEETQGRLAEQARQTWDATQRAEQEAQQAAAEARRADWEAGRAGRAEARSAELEESLRIAGEAQQRAEQDRLRVAEAHERERRYAAEERQRAADELAALNASLAQLQDSHQQLSDWAGGIERRLIASEAWAQELGQRLQDMHHSTSWKITRPLRAAGSVVHALRRPQLARRIVTRLTANEKLRRLLIPVLLRNPKLQQRVSTSIAAIKLDPPQQAPAGIDVPDQLKGLPASVRVVLADLQRARSKQEN